jgi:hypothetical protein
LVGQRFFVQVRRLPPFSAEKTEGREAALTSTGFESSGLPFIWFEELASTDIFVFRRVVPE